MPASGPIRPGDRDLDLLSESGRRDLAGNPADCLGRDAADRRNGLRRIARIEIALGDELKYRHGAARSEEHTSELQSRRDLVCRLLLEKKKKKNKKNQHKD